MCDDKRTLRLLAGREGNELGTKVDTGGLIGSDLQQQEIHCNSPETKKKDKSPVTSCHWASAI